MFCKMLTREVAANIAYEDDATFAIVDLRQPRVGHTLVIPKRHIENVFDLDDPSAAAVMRAVRIVAQAVQDAFAPEGLSLWQSNGLAAGQEVPHFHMHVKPRWIDDGLLRIYPDPLVPVEPIELERQAAAIRG